MFPAGAILGRPFRKSGEGVGGRSRLSTGRLFLGYMKDVLTRGPSCYELGVLGADHSIDFANLAPISCLFINFFGLRRFTACISKENGYSLPICKLTYRVKLNCLR